MYVSLSWGGGNPPWPSPCCCRCVNRLTPPIVQMRAAAVGGANPPEVIETCCWGGLTPQTEKSSLVLRGWPFCNDARGAVPWCIWRKSQHLHVMLDLIWAWCEHVLEVFDIVGNRFNVTSLALRVGFHFAERCAAAARRFQVYSLRCEYPLYIRHDW